MGRSRITSHTTGHIRGTSTIRIDLQVSEVGAEIIEASMADAKQVTVRTRDKPRANKGDAVHVAVPKCRVGGEA